MARAISSRRCVAVGQRAGGVVGALDQADAVEPVARLLDRRALGARGSDGRPNSPAKVKPDARISALCCATIRFSSTVMPANRRMFWKVRATRARCGDAEIEQPLQQVRSCRPRCVEPHHAGGRLVEAGDAVEHRGLAGAVRADQRGDLAALRREATASSTATSPPKRMVRCSTSRIGRRSSVALRHRGRAALVPLQNTDGSRRETRPRGRQIMITTMARPNTSMRYCSKSRRIRSRRA